MNGTHEGGADLNSINPDKLHHSKWTAARPRNKEKHFLVVKLLRDENDTVTEVSLEAVHSGRVYNLVWKDLKDDDKWIMGWR